jgi:hypothetical protein
VEVGMEKLLLISIDTYRRDNIGKVVGGRPISRFLTEIAGRSVFHNNYYASANWTVPAYASMFTGQPTVGHNFWGVKSLPDQPVDLVFDTLVDAGIRPSLLCAGVLGEADIFKYRSNRYYASTYDPFKLDGTIDLIVERLEQSDFVFFHTFLMHDYLMDYTYRSPVRGLKREYAFIPPEKSARMSERMRQWRKEHFSLTRDELETLERMYYNECLLVDDFLEAVFVEVLGRFPGLDIIVNSDHGECFSHCGKHAFGDDWAWILWPLWHHSSGLCYEQFEVFAIECGSSVTQGGLVDGELMDHEDIYRMILERFGLPIGPRVPKSQIAVSTGYDKFGFCGILEGEEIYLFDLGRDMAFVLNDHLYSHTVIPPDRHKIARYRRLLAERLRKSESSSEASDSVRARLQGFGYL